MTITLTEISAFISENLGGDPEVLDSTRIANRAGRLLERSRLWNWLRRTPVNLDLTASQAYVALPSDFGRLVALHGSSGNYILMVDNETFGHHKLYDLGNDFGGYYGTITVASKVRRLDLYPTPAANVTDAMVLSYYAQWTPLTTGTDEADIPADVEDLYLEFVRIAARGVEEDDVASTAARLSEIRQSILFADAVEWDIASQPMLGKIRGGIGSRPPHVDATVVF